MHLGRLFPYHLCSQTAGGLLMAGAPVRPREGRGPRWRGRLDEIEGDGGMSHDGGAGPRWWQRASQLPRHRPGSRRLPLLALPGLCTANGPSPFDTGVFGGDGDVLAGVEGEGVAQLGGHAQGHGHGVVGEAGDLGNGEVMGPGYCAIHSQGAGPGAVLDGVEVTGRSASGQGGARPEVGLRLLHPLRHVGGRCGAVGGRIGALPATGTGRRLECQLCEATRVGVWGRGPWAGGRTEVGWPGGVVVGWLWRRGGRWIGGWMRMWVRGVRRSRFRGQWMVQPAWLGPAAQSATCWNARAAPTTGYRCSALRSHCSERTTGTLRPQKVMPRPNNRAVASSARQRATDDRRVQHQGGRLSPTGRRRPKGSRPRLPPPMTRCWRATHADHGAAVGGLVTPCGSCAPPARRVAGSSARRGTVTRRHQHPSDFSALPATEDRGEARRQAWRARVLDVLDRPGGHKVVMELVGDAAKPLEALVRARAAA